MNDLELLDNQSHEYEHISSICVYNYKKHRIRRYLCCLSPNYLDFDWKKIYINYDRVTFLVYYTDQYPSYGLVIRPAKKYPKIEFEQLFDFGFKGFSSREITLLLWSNSTTPYLSGSCTL